MVPLHIDVERTRYTVLAVGDIFKGRFDTVDQYALQFIGVLIQETKTENTEGIRIGFLAF